MRDHKDNGFSMMMWMMVICCLAPFVFLLIAGKGLAIQGWRGWSMVVIALGLIGFHFWQMRKPRGNHPPTDTTPPQGNKNSPNQLK